jgi:hypothetical protein
MIKKILLKILGNSIYNPEPIELQKMQDWLYMSYGNDGFKHYYTMRKKYLINLLALDIEGKERIKTIGRLEELRGLSANIKAEFKKRKLENKKA